jgi:hypothetical protein
MEDMEMAQYAVLIYADDSAHSAEATPEDVEAHDRHGRELAESGALVAAFALQPRAMATSVRGDAMTDGPFVDAKEVVAGFYVIEAPDLDAALAIAAKNPATQLGGGVEVRPVAGGFVRSSEAG